MSLWRHFYDREKTVEQLTAGMIEWQEKWHWDFLKVNPPACYHALVWGSTYQFFDDSLKEPELMEPVVRQASDVDRIGVIDPASGHLGEQLEVIRNLRKQFGDALPIVETVFSPIEIAHRLMTGRDALSELRKDCPQVLHRLLRTITDTFKSFTLECLNSGADGIFFATKWATSDQMTWNEYQEFGKQYELEMLDELKKRDALIILHVCGDRTFLPQMLDYPADIFSYDFFAEGAPNPLQVAAQTRKYVLGGISPDKLVSNSDEVIDDCAPYKGENRWLIGPSCVVLPQTPDEAIRKTVQALRPAGDPSSPVY